MWSTHIMANEEHHRGEDDDEQFQAVFGELTGISDCLRDVISEIRNNNPHTKGLFTHHFDDDYAGALSDVAWEVLGLHIANNTHIEQIDLDDNAMSDGKATSLFRGLTKSSSIEVLDLMRNTIGINTMRSMVPFLKNSPNLSTLRMSRNSAIGSEGFEIAMQSLNGSAAMEELYFAACNIEDVSSLETYPLSNLRSLSLGYNPIGREGCITIANLLQKEDSNLTSLSLIDVGMGDDEAEIIAASLKYNTKLQKLGLEDNDDIGQRGCRAFLKMLTDIASIESTYNSNHTLKEIFLQDDDEEEEEEKEEECPVIREIDIARRHNSDNSNPEASWRAKIIHSHLNSQNRKRLCQLQGIEYKSDNLFADMEPALLPKVLELIGNNHGQSEFYTALVPMAPDLMSYIDTKAIIKEMIANRIAQIAALTAEQHELSERLAIMESGDSKHSSYLPMAGKKQLVAEDEGSRVAGIKRKKC